MNYRAFTLAALTAFAGCAADDGADPFEGRGGKADGYPDDVPELAESYAVTMQTVIEVCKVTETGECREGAEVNTGTLDIVGFVTMEQSGALFRANLTACEANFTHWDGEVMSAADKLHRENTLRKLGPIAVWDGTVTPEGALDFGVGVVQLGVDLDDPLEGEVPSNKRDSQVIDHDNDDKPGLSFRAPIGKVFAATRGLLSVLVESDGDDGFVGEYEVVGFDFEVLGDNIPFVDVRKKVEEATGDTGFTPVSNTIEFVPAPAECP